MSFIKKIIHHTPGKLVQISDIIFLTYQGSYSESMKRRGTEQHFPLILTTTPLASMGLARLVPVAPPCVLVKRGIRGTKEGQQWRLSCSCWPFLTRGLGGPSGTQWSLHGSCAWMAIIVFYLLVLACKKGEKRLLFPSNIVLIIRLMFVKFTFMYFCWLKFQVWRVLIIETRSLTTAKSEGSGSLVVLPSRQK